jgi:hypothetical protein
METNDRKLLGVIVALMMAAASQAYAQGGQGQHQQREPTQAGPERAHGEQQVDRDRDQDRAADRTQDRDRDQTRDQLHVQDTAQIRDQDIYGSSLMSTTEREQYRQRLQSAKTDQQWARLRMQHQEQMQARARTQNATVEPPIYGQYMLTTQEQTRYRDQLRSAQNEQARIRLREQQQSMVRERARALGVPAPEPIYGQQLMTEQEQQQYRNRLQAAANEQERARIQNEHRTQMQQRAREHQVPADDLEPQS